MRQATLLFLLKDDQILLAMKKRGFGAGHWNGVGGKPDAGESIDQTAVRECQEEIGVKPLNIKEVGRLAFRFTEDKKDWNQDVVVYTCQEWDGEPEETEEMAPRWFNTSEIPYEKMWEDDKYWLPEVLEGKYITGEFRFDAEGKLAEHSVTAN